MVDRNANMIKNSWGKRFRRWAGWPFRASGETVVADDEWLLLWPFACALVRAQCDRERSETKGRQNLDEQFWLTVEKADVVYVGETHDDPADHRYELDLVRGLVKRKVQFAIGWEMFDKTQQAKIGCLGRRFDLIKRDVGRDRFCEALGNLFAGL